MGKIVCIGALIVCVPIVLLALYLPRRAPEVEVTEIKLHTPPTAFAYDQKTNVTFNVVSGFSVSGECGSLMFLHIGCSYL